jgi:hypothetical protein
MPTSPRAFSTDLSEPTAITYVNGIVARTPRAWVYMVTHLPRVWWVAWTDDGCLQATPWLASPRRLMLLSYWRDEAALRRFYAHPVHVKLMRAVFRNPDWFTLWNETYRVPITTRYWNAPNGYALSQPWRPQAMADFYDQHRLHPELADELGVGAGRPPA